MMADQPTQPTDPTPSALERPGATWLEAVLVSVLALAYLLMASPYVLGGDNGEFSAVGAVGGVAHPPGYPLYTIYLRLTSWIPGVSPAHTASLATALLGVGGAWVVSRAAMAWGASPLAAVMAAGIYGLSSLAWTLGTHAEVFALNVLLIAAILTVAAPRGPLLGVWRVLALGGLAGLALANHHSCVLVLPVGVYGVACGAREGRAWWSPFVAAGVLLVALGLPYGYTWWVGRHVVEAAWVWGDFSDLGGLLHHVVRGDYGTTRLAISDATPNPLVHVGAMAQHIMTDLLVVPALLGVVGLGWAVWRGPTRWGAAAVLVTWVLAGPVFVAQFNLELVGIARFIVQRFYLLPQMLLTLGLAWGLDLLFGLVTAARADDDGEGQGMLEPWAPGRIEGLVLGLTLALGAAAGQAHVSEHHLPEVERYLIDSLRPLPENAVLLGTGDHRTFGFMYMREAARVRPDVMFIDPMLMHYPWYTTRVSEQVGDKLTGAVDGNVNTRQLAMELMRTGRPVFLTNLFSKAIVTSLPTYPHGLTIRVLPPDKAPPDPYQVGALNDRIFNEALVDPEQPVKRGTWAGEVRTYYGQPWRSLAQIFAGLGDMERARSCYARARRYEPWLPAQMEAR